MSIDNGLLSSVQSLRHVPIFSNSSMSILIIRAFYSHQSNKKSGMRLGCFNTRTTMQQNMTSRRKEERREDERRESHLLAAAKSMSLVASVIVFIECSDSLQISTFPFTSLIVNFSGLSALSVLFTMRSNIFS